MSVNYTAEICRDSCDDCKQKALGVTSLSAGVPIYHVCKNCNPSLFQRTSEKQKDLWLKTGRLF